MADCPQYGWGEGPWGATPWGGGESFSAGGPIPSVAPFGVYCVGPCGPMAFVDAYDEVSEVYETGQLTNTYPYGDDLRLISGGDVSEQAVHLLIDTSIPTNWTVEYTLFFEELPTDFLDIVNRHLFVGVASSNAFSAGLFFSEQGVIYTGSVLFNNANQLVLNHPTQVLPNSYGLVQPGKYYTVRVAVEAATATTYIYLTESSLVPTTGQTLRYILPALPADNAPLSPVTGTTISAKGTALRPSIMDLNSVCLGAGLLIPNLAPVSVAGRDLAARRCSVLRLNGEQSYDPEGSSLVYAWRLVDGPEVSREVVSGSDGRSLSPSPLTNKFYSVELGNTHALDPIEAGDVLQVYGQYFDIISIGSDDDGFYVQISAFSIPAPRSSATFKVLRQRGLMNADTVSPTFYVDETGVFRFSLTVYDGQLYSLPSDMVANVIESEVARGVTPDMSFLWNYLSNFWNLVDGTDPIDVYWSALAQITASEILALWQHDYSKGLRDVTKTFQRRWLHYGLLLKEPLPSLTTSDYITGGALSALIDSTGAAVVGQVIDVQSPTLGTRTIRFQGDGAISPDYILAQVQSSLGTSFVVSLIPEGPDFRLLIQSEYPFVLTASSNSTLFTYPTVNGLLAGTGGSPASPTTYRVDRSLSGLGVRNGDYLVVDGNAYRISRLTSDGTDLSALQRVIVEGTLPLSSSSNWSIARSTKSTYLDFYNALVSAGDIAFFDITELATGDTLRLPVRVLAAPQFLNNAELLVDCTVLLPYLRSPSLFAVLLDAVVRRTYTPVDPLVQEIPYLQEKIKNEDDSEVLRQNVDFIVSTYRGRSCIKFVTSDYPGLDVWEHNVPPDNMWAEITYLDNRPTIEAQYGRPVDFTLDDYAQLPLSADYLSVVRGLWYSYLNGPTLHNLRVGAQILLGLPFAEESGSIVEIQERFSPMQSRVLVRDTAPPHVTRAYTYPRQLALEVNPLTAARYKIGDTVSQFDPLVEGAEVVDYVKSPEWWKPYQQQGSLLEIEKFFKFLVRVDSDAFSLQTLLFVRSFILRVKPTYTFPLFVVQRQVNEVTVEVIDQLKMTGTLRLFDGVCSFQKSIGLMFDDPDPSGGGEQTFFDSGYPFTPQPVHPAPSPDVYWGYDKELLCPQDYITGAACVAYAVAAYPTMDSVFAWDEGVFTSTLLDEGTSGIMTIPASPASIALGLPVTSAGSYSVQFLELRYDATFLAESTLPITLTLAVNGVVIDAVNVTIPHLHSYRTFVSFGAPHAVNPGDIVRVYVAATGATPLEVQWATVAVTAGAIYNWGYDVQAPAGTYCSTKVM